MLNFASDDANFQTLLICIAKFNALLSFDDDWPDVDDKNDDFNGFQCVWKNFNLKRTFKSYLITAWDQLEDLNNLAAITNVRSQ